MNLEHENRLEINQEKNGLSQLVDLYLENYLNDEKNLPPEIAWELKTKTIPLFNEIGKEIVEKNELLIGGSAMEVMANLITPNEYWGTKYQLKNLQNKIDSENETLRPSDTSLDPDRSGQARAAIKVDSGERLTPVLAALKTLGKGDADFDFYIDKKENLRKIFNKIYKKYGDEAEIKKEESGRKKFDIKLSENIDLIISYGPVYKGAIFYRTNFQLKDKQDNPLFHIDITTLPETGEDKIQNRRHFIGDIHDNCRGKLVVKNNKINVEFKKEEMPKAGYQSKMKLENKDINSIYEVVMREMRKKIMHFTSKNNPQRTDFSPHRIFSLIDTESIFDLREIGFIKNEADNLFEKQSLMQKQMLYQELFLMAQTDPYSTVIFLQDTGMDSLFLGRHLSRKEVLGILASDYLDFLPESEDKLKKRLKESREIYINLDFKDEKKNGAKRFISALGQALGNENEKRNYQIHFKRGLEILGDPKNKMKKLPTLSVEKDLNEKQKEMLEQLNNGGGLTEKGLHYLLNKNNPIKYPNENRINKEKFKKELLELKKTGLIETAKRTIKITDDKEVEAWFYYPCSSSIRIEKILYEANRPGVQSCLIKKAYQMIGVDSFEAALSIKAEELKKSGLLDKLMSLFHPSLILKLITWEEEIKNQEKTRNYLDINTRQKN